MYVLLYISMYNKAHSIMICTNTYIPRRFVFCQSISQSITQSIDQWMDQPGSVGATVRMYIEKYEPDVSKQGLMTADVLRPLVEIGLKMSRLEEFTGRGSPTVIT